MTRIIEGINEQHEDRLLYNICMCATAHLLSMSKQQSVAMQLPFVK